MPSARGRFVGMALLYGAPLVENDDVVGHRDGSQPVGNDNERAFSFHVPQGSRDGLLCDAVQRVRGLVENKNLRLPYKSARQRDSLALSSGQPQTALADAGIVFLGKLKNEIMGIRADGGLDDLIIACIGCAEPDVLPHGGAEKMRILTDETDAAAPAFQV